MRPTLASILSDEDIQNAPRIQMIALLYIFLSFLRRYTNRILLYYHNWKLYSVISKTQLSRSLTVNFILFSLFTLFYFSFSFSFYFSIFRTNSGQGLSVMLSHQSQIDGVITRLRRMEQKVLEQSDVIQHGQHMLALCYTHGHLGQGAQQLARTMGNSI